MFVIMIFPDDPVLPCPPRLRRPNRDRKDRFSPLHRCAQSSDLHSARALLDRNGSGGRGGASPAAGDASVVVCANSDVDVPTRRGDYRAIHLACYAGSADMVSLLARRGADVSAGDKWGASPLHRACLEGHLDAARAVLDAG